MAFHLHIEPGSPGKEWEKFIAEHVPYSIALDGYVVSWPRFDPKGPYANFDHHKGVNRLATRSTCGQVLVAIRQGLMDTFTDQHVWVNDCDQDVCFSVFLLKNPNIAADAGNGVLNKIVEMEDMLDVTGGAYPYPPKSEDMERLAWITAPYDFGRANGALDRKSAEEYAAIIDEVGLRIQEHLRGKSQRIPLDSAHRVTHKGSGWVMAETEGPQPLLGILRAGHRAYVLVRKRGEGQWGYTIGRTSPYVPFDVLHIIEQLNAEDVKRDPSRAEDKDFWGGSDVIAGAPRKRGSALTPDEVFEIVERSRLGK